MRLALDRAPFLVFPDDQRSHAFAGYPVIVKKMRWTHALALGMEQLELLRAGESFGGGAGRLLAERGANPAQVG